MDLKLEFLHGAAQYVIQDKEGQIGSTESISAGLIILEYLTSLFFKRC